MSARPLAAALTLLALCLACASARPTPQRQTEARDDDATAERQAREDEGDEDEGDEASAPPPLTLTEVDNDDGFRVRMPGQPQVQRQRVTIPAGVVDTAAWSVQTPQGVIYSISLADYPEAVVAARPPQAFLDEGRDGLSNQLRGEVRTQRPLTLDGHPGHDYVVSSPNGEVHARNFMVGRRLYTLLVLYNPAIGAPEAGAFFDSFGLTRRVAPVQRATPAP